MAGTPYWGQRGHCPLAEAECSWQDGRDISSVLTSDMHLPNLGKTDLQTARHDIVKNEPLIKFEEQLISRYYRLTSAFSQSSALFLKSLQSPSFLQYIIAWEAYDDVTLTGPSLILGEWRSLPLISSPPWSSYQRLNWYAALGTSYNNRILKFNFNFHLALNIIMVSQRQQYNIYNSYFNIVSINVRGSCWLKCAYSVS